MALLYPSQRAKFVVDISSMFAPIWVFLMNSKHETRALNARLLDRLAMTATRYTGLALIDGVTLLVALIVQLVMEL